MEQLLEPQVAQKLEITEENKVVLLCVYGTLLKDYGNWAYFLKNKSKFLGTFQTKPEFTMYNTGGFPIVSPSGNTSIECDVFEIKQNSVLQRIHQLEGFRGIIGSPDNWYDVMPIETPYGQAYMYIQEGEHQLPIVKSGKWRSKN